LADKERTQEVFHTIFNDFVWKNKQIVISSDRPPKDLRDIEERLKSRFAHWLVWDIKTPDFETRLAILKQKLMTVDNEIAQELLEIVAKYVKENVRELEWALNLFLTKRKFSWKELDQHDIYEWLWTLGYKFSNELQKTMETPMVNQKWIQWFTDILNHVSNYYDIPASEIVGESRKKEVSQTRQLMMYIAKKHFHRTLEKIGEYFGWKNHATVIYAVNNFQKILKSDQQIESEYNQFVDKIWN
jgi:chromosomal replication initiator protein